MQFSKFSLTLLATATAIALAGCGEEKKPELEEAARREVKAWEDARRWVAACGAGTTTELKAAAPTGSTYQQAKALEAGGNVKGAVRLYLRAVKEGDFNAAKALGDIYAEGKGDVGKDYADSLHYYQLADQLADKNGVEVPRARAFQSQTSCS